MLPKEKIRRILTDQFHPTKLVITDDSRAHSAHNPAAAGGGTHFTIEIVSAFFTDKKLLERHRLVYAALQEGLKTHIHALAIKAYTPSEI